MVGLLLALVAVAINLSLFFRLDRIDGAFDGLVTRPAAAPGETILMIGTRPGGNVDVPWLSGEQSVESVMLVEISEDRRRVQVDSMAVAGGLGASAASSLPNASVGAVESSTGRRVDHLMAVDWRTFAQLASDNGVDLDYRYGSSARVQHDFLREVITSSLHAELRKEPLNLYRALGTAADGTAIDDEWSLLALDRLVLSLRNLRSQDIGFSLARPR